VAQLMAFDLYAGLFGVALHAMLDAANVQRFASVAPLVDQKEPFGPCIGSELEISQKRLISVFA